MSRVAYFEGVLRERWDDVTRTYTSWNQQGQQTGQRAYTAQENAEADARAAIKARETNRQVITDAARAALTSNLADITQAEQVRDQANTLSTATFASNTARDNAIRSLATGVRVLATHDIDAKRQLNRLIRLVLGDLESTQ